ncbi:MAG: GNAT family N-acetyltransferase [Actinomycetota bacterium]|nr:GNAT family N-acetyltransferase [Actinomycetota bacterium]
MNVRRIEDPASFLDVAGPLLLADEARHSLILGLAGTLRDHPEVYSDHSLWVVEDDGRVVSAGMQTPPFNVVVARPSVESATDALAHALIEADVAAPGVTGARPEADVFAEAWEARAHTTSERRRRGRIYRLTRVRPIKPLDVRGRPRSATEDDRPLLISWLEAFAREALGEEPSSANGAKRAVNARLRHGAGGFQVWEDDEPVSLAGWGGTTPNGVRIGPVYTPPEHRRRGYASALTAAVSAERLASGRRFCFLYTDLDNPTSNKIYMDIGYEPVCDSVEYAFVSR